MKAKILKKGDTIGVVARIKSNFRRKPWRNRKSSQSYEGLRIKCKICKTCI